MDEGFGGFADLGAVLAGGDRSGTRDAYMKGANQAASLETTLANARIKRDEAMQREQLRARLIGSGMKPEEAELLETVMRSGTGSDFSSGMMGLGRQQQNQARGIALEDVIAGAADPTRQNRALAVAGDRPLRTADVDGGYVLDPYGPATQDLQDTPVALERVLAEQALTGSRNASADANHARAAQTRDKTAHPDKYKAAPKAKAADSSAPKVGEVRKGYRYNGGDPAKRESWSKAG